MNVIQWIKQLTGDQLMQLKDSMTLLDSSAKHAYDVQVTGGRTVRVEANNRTSASARARAIGFKVMSVNMVG